MSMNRGRGAGPARGGGGYQGQGGGGRGGGGGQQQGGGYSQPRGPAMTVSNSTDIYPKIVTKEMLALSPFGWLHPNIDVEDLQPPPAVGPGSIHSKRIALIVNHIVSTITLPEKIYQYEINVDLSEEDQRIRDERKKNKKGAPRRGGAAAAPDDDSERPGVSHTASEYAPKPRLWKKIVKYVIPLLERWHNESVGKGGQIKVATDGFKQIYTTQHIAQVPREASYGATTIDWFPNGGNGGYHQANVALAELEDESENDHTTFVVQVKLVDSIVAAGNPALREYIRDMVGFVVAHGGQIPPDAIRISQVYNIVLKTGPLFRHGVVPVGRASFFPTPPGDGFPLHGGLVNWSGHSLIFNFGWKPFINIDLANSAFLLGRSVYDVLTDLVTDYRWDNNARQEVAQRPQADPANGQTWNPAWLKKANNLLKTCMVQYSYGAAPGTTYSKRVTEVSNKPARLHTFTDRDGRDTNVAEYCRSKGSNLRNANGLCLILGGKNVVPAELCRVKKGQSFNGKLGEAQTAAMIKDTAKIPAKRLEAIKSAIQENGFGKGQDPTMKEFGVEVSKDGLLEVKEARILPRPVLIYGSNQVGQQKRVETGPDAVWSMNGLKFVRPVKANCPWGVVVVDAGGRWALQEHELDQFIKFWRASGENMGLIMGEPVMKEKVPEDRNLKNNLKALFEKLQKAVKLVVVVIPRKDTNVYAPVKQASELLVQGGILTQCVVEGNVKKCSPATVDNLILKVNSKLGGQNYYMLGNTSAGYEKISILKAPVMILGADVTHPPPGSKIPSMAAVTCSIDRTGMPFMMHTQAQRKTEAEIKKNPSAAEVIRNLRGVIKNMIGVFIKKTGHKPRKLIFYRDGVGDSQFNEVLQKEMMEIRGACEDVAKDAQLMALAKGDVGLEDPRVPFQPKITFIAVQKRHKTRFFPKNQADGVGNPKNAPPGTVVDTDIVSAGRTDFYLLSHIGIQGTSKPTRYQVLWDDSEFNANELELLSYYLCFMYCRCTRSVSYPAPTYYAHLAATRAKVHIHGIPDEDLQDIGWVNQQITRQPQMISQFPMHFV